MEKTRLNICSLGAPTDPRTWSGTPFNVYSQLSSMDRLGSAFSSDGLSNRYWRKCIHLLGRRVYGTISGLERGFPCRFANAARVGRQTAKSSSNLTLHMGSLSLPFWRLPKNQRHFLFTDSTWNLWSSGSTGLQGYSRKLLADAETLEKAVYRQVEHIFPIGEYVKADLTEHYGISPGKVTPVGTGLGIIKPFYGDKNYSNGKILFAAKGRFEDKGGRLVLEAFTKALLANRGLELTVVGQNDYAETLQLPNVKAYGFVSVEELQNIFNSGSLFLMPAVNEPWGLVFLEALACKMPIVGLNRNGFPELSGFGRYGFGLDDASPEKLAKILLDAFDNPERLRLMGLEGQRYCLNTFSWRTTVGKILETIENTAR
jgi:glycosyltransferase involved in cell wall biosynthesis